MHMDCDRAREALSARIDGEDPGVGVEALEQHLDGCAACAGWREALLGLAGRLEAADDPDPALRRAVLERLARERAAQEDRRAQRALRPLRVALGVVALVQPALVVPALLSGPAHDARELGSWHLALAVGFLFAAIRPSRAWGMLPLVAALAGGLVITACVDVLQGNARPGEEVAHAVDLVGLGCLWVLGRRPPAGVGPLRPA